MMKRMALLVLIAGCTLTLVGCGGDGGSATAPSSPLGKSIGSPSGTSNTVGVIVDSGPAAAGGTVNEPFVSITICSPSDPSTCRTIDHILVDTGSFGLRIISSVLSPSLSLPPETDSGGNVIAECAMFADGYAWGPVRMANLQIGGESADSVPIQVIGDPAYSALVSQNCSSTGIAENTVATFGANGVLGVGPFAQDCGTACSQSADTGYYYVCGAASCAPAAVSLAQQVPNPVTFFAADNNGVVLAFPAVPANGTENLSGTLTFGVDTQSDNALGSATVYSTDESGYITTMYNGATYADSLLDSGSTGFFFTDNSIAQCSDGSGLYCPASTLNLSAVNVGQNGGSGTVSFAIGNADNMFANNPNFTAFGELGGTNGDAQGFDWGLPFFFGRTVYTALEGYSTSGGAGPYFAY